MGRIQRNSKWKMPKNISIQLKEDANYIAGPYVKLQPEKWGYKNVEFELCEVTGNYIRKTPKYNFED